MRLAAALTRELSNLEPPAESIGDIIGQWPSIGELAEWWSGTSNKKSREYRTARRRFERYRAGAGGAAGEKRRPSPEVLEYIRERLEERRQEQLAQPLSLEIRGDVQVSKDRRHRKIRLELDGEDVERILRALEEGDDEQAEDAFGVAVASQMGGQVPAWHDVDRLQVWLA